MDRIEEAVKRLRPICVVYAETGPDSKAIGDGSRVVFRDEICEFEMTWPEIREACEMRAAMQGKLKKGA